MTDAPSPPTPAAPAAPASPSSVPSRFSGWPRRALRWATGLLVVFALGLGATWLAQVRPLQLRVQDLDKERQALSAQVAELQGQVNELEAVRSENSRLEVLQAKLELHQHALQALTAVSQAQVLLADGSASTSPQEWLGQADVHLAELQALLAGSLQEDVRGLRDRLALVAGEWSSDRFAAQRDLEVLVNGLLNLEQQLSGA